MASAIKLLATQMEAMEASFLSIFFQAANKISNLTDSKLFFLMETSDGIYKIGGNSDLKLLFQAGKLAPRNSDVVIDEEDIDEESPSPMLSLLEATPFSKMTNALKETAQISNKSLKRSFSANTYGTKEVSAKKKRQNDGCSKESNDNILKHEGDFEVDDGFAAPLEQFEFVDEAGAEEGRVSDLDCTDEEVERSSTGTS